MATTDKYVLGTIATLLSTELNSLANNTNCTLGGVFNNTQAGGGRDGYTLCDVEGLCTFAPNPQANTGVRMRFLETADGPNYEDVASTVTPSRLPNVVLPVTSGQTGTRVNRQVLLPWGNFKPLARNDGTGQSMAASGNTIKIRPATTQEV